MPLRLASRDPNRLADDELRRRSRVDRRLEADAEAVDGTRDLPRRELDARELAGEQVGSGLQGGRVRRLPRELHHRVAVDVALDPDDERARCERLPGGEADDGPRRQLEARA